MRLTLSTKYAVIALGELARRAGPVSIPSLSAATGIPSAYLGKVVSLLVRHGLLVSARGRGGGISLAKPAEEISLRDIILAVEGPRALQDCPFDPEPCPGDPQCPLFPVWDPLRERIISFLEETSLAEVARRTPKEEG